MTLFYLWLVKKLFVKYQLLWGGRYITGRLINGKFMPSRYGREYKTKSGALRAISR